MNCSKCGISCSKTPLYRTVPLGNKCEVWHCWDCLSPELKKGIPKETKEISDLITEDNKNE